MTAITDLSSAVEARYGAKYLYNMTNPDDSTATTVNSTIMDAASADVIGAFQMETGVAFAADNSTHMYIAIEGVAARLESYKSRDSGIMNSRWNHFLGALTSFRKKRAVLPDSNSMLQAYKETSLVRPDMSRDRAAFSGGVQNPAIKEISD